jgi:ubiquinone/menaquinone biosynthesis C-methylase UbiE
MSDSKLTAASFNFDTFLNHYERLTEPVTLPAALQSLDLTDVAEGTRLIDVAAGTGGFAVAAAARGARVLATDLAPGMVARTAERLRSYEGCEARVMSCDALQVPDATFDASFSHFGILALPNARKGLDELVRVTRPGGWVAVSYWDQEACVAPQYLLQQVFKGMFPDRQLWPDNFVRSWSNRAIAEALREAGCVAAETFGCEGRWTVTSPKTVMLDQGAAFAFFPGLRELTPSEYEELGQAFGAAIEHYAGDDGVAQVPTRAIIAVGRKAGVLK